MDYGRLFLFMAAATAVMAIGTHLWCWIYSTISRVTLYWRIDRLRKQLEMDNLQEEELERRRAVAPRYKTWEEAMGDFRGGVPLDDILDRLNGEFPPNAADIQKPRLSASSNPKELENAISGQVLATTLTILAITCFGICPPKLTEKFIRWARENGHIPPSGIGT